MYLIEPGVMDIANPCKHLPKIQNTDNSNFQGKNLKPHSMFSIFNITNQF